MRALALSVLIAAGSPPAPVPVPAGDFLGCKGKGHLLVPVGVLRAAPGDRLVVRGDPARREFVAFCLQDQRVVAGMYANPDGETFLEDINPGNQITAVIVFDVAAGMKLVTLEVHDSAFSRGAKVALA